MTVRLNRNSASPSPVPFPGEGKEDSAPERGMAGAPGLVPSLPAQH